MVKFKNVARSSTPPPAEKRTSSARRRPVSKPAGSAGIVIGVVGWVVAVGFGVGTAVVAKRCSDEISRLRATVPVEMEKLQESVNLRQAEVSRRRTELGKVINKNISDQSGLIAQNQALELLVKELEPEAASLTQNRDRLQKGVDALKEDIGLMGEGVGDLRKKLQDLVAKRAALIGEYRQRYQLMLDVYKERMARPEPEMIRQFYSGHRHTPFAPAAGFHAAEKMYQKRRSQDALRYYLELVERFPDSEYVAHARTRIAQIQENERYEPFSPLIGFIPYQVPGFVKGD